MEEVGEQDDVFDSVVFEVLCPFGKVVDEVGLVAVERLVDERDAVFGGSSTGGLEGIGEPGESEIAGDFATPFSLHGAEDGGRTQLSAEVDHLEDEIEGSFTFFRIDVGEGKSVFDHAGAGADSGDPEVVFGCESLDFIDRDEIRSGKKEFNGVIAMPGSGSKTFG